MDIGGIEGEVDGRTWKGKDEVGTGGPHADRGARGTRHHVLVSEVFDKSVKSCVNFNCSPVNSEHSYPKQHRRGHICFDITSH
jgi:hypothetical protein